MHVFLLSLSAPSSTCGPGAFARPLGAAPHLAPQCPLLTLSAWTGEGEQQPVAFGDSVTACHQLPGKSRARLARDAVRSLTKNTREVFEQAGGTLPWAESRGACFLCSSLPHCPLCSFPGPGGWALPFSLFPTCTQGKAKYRGCEDVPSTGPWEQAEGLSEPSLLLDRCLEKEGKAIFYCGMSLCIPAARSRGWGTAPCPPPTAPVQGQLPRCWGQATPVPARPSCQPQDGEGGTVGGCGTHPKQGDPFSLLWCPFPPPGHGTEPARPPGHSARSPFLLPRGQTTARKSSPEPEQGAAVGTGCPVPGSVQQTRLLPSACPVSLGRHGGLPWTALANGGRCQPACRAGGCQEWGALL